MVLPTIEMASGDIVTLNFLVVDEDGDAVNLSAFGEILLEVFATSNGRPTGASVVSENLAGDVNLVGGGTGGEFSVDLVAAYTASLAGRYWLEVLTTDAGGNDRTLPPLYLDIRADLLTS